MWLTLSGELEVVLRSVGWPILWLYGPSPSTKTWSSRNWTPVIAQRLDHNNPIPQPNVSERKENLDAWRGLKHNLRNACNTIGNNWEQG